VLCYVHNVPGVEKLEGVAWVWQHNDLSFQYKCRFVHPVESKGRGFEMVPYMCGARSLHEDDFRRLTAREIKTLRFVRHVKGRKSTCISNRKK